MKRIYDSVAFAASALAVGTFVAGGMWAALFFLTIYAIADELSIETH